MRLLVDADSCPSQARTVILRAARRRGLEAVFAANREIPGIAASGALMLNAGDGEGAADDALVREAAAGDIAVTRDVPLAKRLLERGAAVLDDRGRIFTQEDICERLSVRNFTVTLAEAGLAPPRERGYTERNLREFAAALDKVCCQQALEKVLKNPDFMV